MLGLKRGTVLLAPHEKEWETFAVETMDRLRAVLGDTAVEMQHVGSTAVPAIQAKPIVDLAVAVRSLSDVEPLFPALEAQGFYHAAHGDDEGQILLVCGDLKADTRTCHIHVVRAGSMEWRNYVNFRDYLNFYPKKAAEYEALKQELQRRFPNDRNAYTEGKAEWIAYTLRKALVWSFLGEKVHVEMDRPIGTEHPKHPGLYYPINYGYLPGVVGGDGEELDVYVMGVQEPLKTFDGRVIGIVHRQDDNEDKLAAAPDGMIFDQAQIARQVSFQEKYYHSEVEPLYHHSCGVIPCRPGEKGFEYLLLLQRESNTWSFPKGHQEMGETERETALREAWEETGCRAELWDGFRQEITYALKERKGQKRVTLFLGRLEGELSLRREEIAASRWMNAEQALALLHKGYRPILEKAEDFLSKQG